jgi:hypothetical protein
LKTAELDKVAEPKIRPKLRDFLMQELSWLAYCLADGYPGVIL